MTSIVDGKSGTGQKKWIFLRKNPAEILASVIIGIGIVMQVQPYSFALFGYSVGVIIIGIVLFTIASHLSE